MAKTICTVYKSYTTTPLNTLAISDLTVILTSPLPKYHFNQLAVGLFIPINIPSRRGPGQQSLLCIAASVSLFLAMVTAFFFPPSPLSPGISEQQPSQYISLMRFELDQIFHSRCCCYLSTILLEISMQYK